MIQVKVYQSPDGRRSFNEWFQGLEQATALKIARAVSQLEHGNFSDSRSVGEGVIERRIHSGPGFRIYYARVGRTLVLLLAGGIKRSQKSDIQRAVVYWRELKSR
jgi:putative addiction module killer protein